MSLFSLPLLAGAASAAPSSIVIDGNQDGVGDDWQGLSGTPRDPHFQLIADPVGNADTTTFNNSERDYPNWQAGSDGTASGKSDIGNVYVYDYRAGTDLIVALAWDRAGDTGTGRYYVELNQKPNQGLVNDRTVGDQRITIGINGADDLECKFIQPWTASGWGTENDCSSISVSVNDSDITDYFGSPNDSAPDTLERNTFVETVINLTDFDATTCPVSGFQSLSIRSQEGNENGDTSALKDRATGNVDIPSDCGAIKIEKRDHATGELVNVAGSVFKIEPDPTAGSSSTGPKYVKDNNGGPAGYLTDSDPTVGKITITDVDPDTYTVTETAAPAGYLLPPPGCNDGDTDRCTVKTVAIGGTATFVFKDKRQYAAPTIGKNAAALYDETYTWDIEKTVSDDDEDPGPSATQNVPEGTKATFDYAVTLSQGQRTTSNYRVTGTVTLGNSNALPMTVTLEDALEDGTECSFTTADADAATPGHQVVLAANAAAVQVGYTCSPGDDAEDGTNVATVTWDKGRYPQTQEDVNTPPSEPGTDSAQAPYAFAVDGETDKTVSVTDDQHDFDPAWEKTWGEGVDPETRSYVKEFAGEPGTCTDYDNTATITETDQSASAAATVCVGQDLVVTKNVVASLTRTYAFDIDKSADATALEVNPDTGKAEADYTVVVTDGAATDSLWVMTGTIFVSNPNDWQGVTLTDIADAYDGDGDSCEVDTTGGLEIAADAEDVEFPYTCTFDEKPSYDGNNVATITWDKAKAATPSGSDSGTVEVAEEDWDVDEVGKTVTIIDDKTVPGETHELGEVTWQGKGTQTSFSYSLQLDGVPGRCVDYTNTATIVQTKQTADETVTVCAPQGVRVEKTGAGTYDRTYRWLIDKEADQTEVSIDGGQAEFDYTVTATPDGYVDSGWTMTGAITVANPNDFQTMTVDITDVPDVGGGAVCTVEDGEGVLIPKATVVDDVLVPAEVTRNYSCTFTAKPTYTGGSNKALATWDGGSAMSGATPIVFSLDDETNKEITVTDDMVDLKAPEALGTADWNADGEPTEFEYTLTQQGVSGECTDYTNTAVIEETEQEASETVTLCVQAPLSITKTVDASYDRTYLWTIAKAADRTQVEISSGSASFRYTVTVSPTTFTDSGWAMVGVISVVNPNDAEVGAITADVTDVTDVGGTCEVDGGQELTVQPGETVDLEYSCSFTEKPAYKGQNTATATWQGNQSERSVSDAVDVEFELDQETNRTIDVYDDKVSLDPAVLLGTADWLEGERSFQYDLQLAGVAGACTSYTNTATIAQTQQSADETVTVCRQASPVLANRVAGSFDRTYAWEIAKRADGTTFDTGDEGSAEIGYTVDVTPGSFTDSGWTMVGALTVTNPNTYKSLTVNVTPAIDLGGGAVCTLDAGQSPVVPAGGQVTYGYSCAFDSQPAYVGTDSTRVTWDLGAAEVATPVELLLDGETDRVVDVVDDQTKPGSEVPLGQAEWNADGTPTTFTYTLDLDAEANECEEYTNTAEIVQTEQADDVTVEVCGPEILPTESFRPPPLIKGVEGGLPTTGGPSLGLTAAGLALLISGIALMVTSRRRRSLI